MNHSYKNKGKFINPAFILGIAAAFLGAALLLFIYSTPSQETVCEQLRNMRAIEMSAEQKETAQKCDAIDAERAWEAQYGTMSEEEKMNAVVYEE